MGYELIHPSEEICEYVELNLREGDRMERDFGGGTLRLPENAPSFAVVVDGKIFGVGGFMLPADQTTLSNVRVVWFLSTEHVNGRKIYFVKNSRRVLKEMALSLPDWVDTIVAAPMNDYTMSVVWLERVIGMRKVKEVEHQGAKFSLMVMSRKELEDV